MNGSEYVKKYYKIEEISDIALHDAISMNFSLRMPADQLALFDALAHRFRTSRNGLASEILEQFAKDAFAELNKSDRRKVAEKADELGKAYFEKLGVDVYNDVHQRNAGAWERAETFQSSEEGKS
jgi:hypothetical protein